jgi:hypothetical protein
VRRTEEKLWIMMRTWTDWNPIRKLLGKRAFIDGADVKAGE